MTHHRNSSIHSQTVEAIVLSSSLRSIETHNPTETYHHRTLSKLPLQSRDICSSESNGLQSFVPTKSTSTPWLNPTVSPDTQKPGGSDGESDRQPPETLQDRMNLFMSRLDEQQRRWFVALVAEQLGRGGIQKMSQVTGMHPDTIRRGRKELEAGLVDRPKNRARRSGGGRPGKSSSSDKVQPNKKTRE